MGGTLLIAQAFYFVHNINKITSSQATNIIVLFKYYIALLYNFTREAVYN